MGPSCFGDVLDQRTDGVGIGHVGLHGDGLAAGLLDFGDDFVRAGLAAGIVDCDGCALRCKFERDGCANALGCAGYQCDFALKFAHDSAPLPSCHHFDISITIELISGEHERIQDDCGKSFGEDFSGWGRRWG